MNFSQMDFANVVFEDMNRKPFVEIGTKIALRAKSPRLWSAPA